ncbi:MAG: 2-hydroxyacid dehydrogenase [Bacteroidota bacterium]
MKVVVFSNKPYETPYLKAANNDQHKLTFLSERLTTKTVDLAKGHEAIALFSSDEGNQKVLKKLADLGVQLIALRSAGFNHVDLSTAAELGLKVLRVPEYSPYAVAEHTVALMLALNRKVVKANARIKELNFSLGGLVGFDVQGKTVGVIGTGRIGEAFIKIMHGFGCEILAFDKKQDSSLTEKYDVQFVALPDLLNQADIISLHVPLNKHTKYIIDKTTIAQMKKGVMLLNTSRGGLVDTKAVVTALKSHQIGYFGMDVYEDEKGLFFEDHSDGILQDDVLARLMSFPNVLITSHQGFLTETALRNISETTIQNITDFEDGKESGNEVTV